MNVLITGSSGQIGTNTALALQDRGHQVMGIDVRPNSWTDRIETLSLDLTQASPGDLPAGKRFDVVLHLAAHAKVFELVEQPHRALENVKMLFTVLEYCRQAKTPIIFSSSREVYGDIHHHVTQESLADFVVAESPYSASKIAGEAFVYSYEECYGLPFLVYRFSNVYGRFDNDIERMERVIPLFIRRINAGEDIVLFGREKVLDFTYVDDAVDGILRGIEGLAGGKVMNQTFNIAFGQGNTLDDVVNLISLATGREASVSYEPARAGEVMRYVADLSHAREFLGYRPQTPLSKGLPLSVKWQREQGFI
jgi:UDP-glucose 4-epimerase